MKIVCLNGWGGKLFDALHAYLRAEDPDVLCLQEVVHSPATDLDWLTYRDGDHVLPQRANFLRDVQRALPGHVATFCPAAQGVLWNGAHPVASQWGLATFVRGSLPVIGQAQGFVHGSFSPHGYGEHPRPRNAHALRVYNPTQDRTVSIAHMHGLRDLRGKGDTPERAAQAARFLALADQVSDPQDIRVLCGDFNVEPGSATLALLAAAGFVDQVTAGGFGGTRTSHYVKPGRFADYLLIDRVDVVLRFDVITSPEVSDHCPLVLEI